jgi:sugar phosphate isomerase/epimerase
MIVTLQAEPATSLAQLSDRLTRMRSLGIDSSAIALSGSAVDISDDHLADAARTVELAGNRVVAILCDSDQKPDSDSDVAQRLSALIRMAVALDAFQVQVCPALWWSDAGTSNSEEARRQRVASGLAGLQAQAEDAAVDLVLDLAYTGFLTTPSLAADFIDELAASPFGLALDLQAPPVMHNPLDWLMTLSHRVRSLRGLWQHPSAEAILHTLSLNHYAGILIAETDTELAQARSALAVRDNA